MKSGVELRCQCSKRPLLGIGYRDPFTGEPRLHVKIFKQGRVFGEMIATSGVVHLRCRECDRWSKVTIRRVQDMSLLPPDDDVVSSLSTNRGQ